MVEFVCKKYLFFLVACSAMSILSSCKGDEPAPTGKTLALTFLREGLSATAEVIVTDPDGNLLESQLVNGQLNFFSTSEAVVTYDVTIIDLISANSYAIKTYQKVPSSSYFIKGNTAAVVGLHRISFPNIANYKHFTMQSEQLKTIVPVSDTEFDLQLTQTKSDLFLTVEKDNSGIPSYFVAQQAEVGKTTVIDATVLSKFNAMTAKLINSTQSQTDSYHYKVFGNIGDAKRLLISSYDPATVFQPAPVNLYYPAGATLFSNYTTQISFDIAKGNYLATITQYQTGLAPSETDDQLESSLTSYQDASGSYQFVLAGNAEWTHAQLAAVQGDKSIYWDVYTAFSTQNTIKIPEFLISYLNQKQFTFANEMKFRLIECGNDAFTFGYEDFLKLELKRDDEKPLIQTRFTTGYKLPQ